MAELKTKNTGEGVSAFLDGLHDARMRADRREVARMMREASGVRAGMRVRRKYPALRAITCSRSSVVHAAALEPGM